MRNKGYIGNNAIEKSIAAIWQDILGQRVDHVEQSFFELGGNSIAAVRVAEAVEKLLDTKMPLALLIKHNTIKSLAEALHNGAKPHFQILVPIQPQGDRSPVFGVHAEGNVLFYRDLSQCMGSTQPFFGLQSPELGDGVKPYTSIEEMAASYIQEIKRVKPTGPYNLCGMCFGGLIAFEIAQQLVESGDKVGALIVFDAGGPQMKNSSAPSSASIRTKFRYSRTAPLIVKVFKHLKTGRLLRLAKNYIYTTPIVYNLLNRFREKNTEQSARERIKQVRLNQTFLTRQYRAKEYQGRVSFLYSEQFKNSEKTQFELSLWSAACGGRLESFLVSGHHRSILEPPQVYEVAEIVKSVLHKVP
ncbi:MAG: thioesterase domain-containing protein, partial [bacterium]